MTNKLLNHETEQKTDKFAIVPEAWLTLLRIVAIAMIVVNFIPMVFILKQFIPQLAIANGLFAIVLLLTWIRPRVGAIGVGVLSVTWLVSNFAKLSQVIPDLTNPSATLFFMVTVAHIVLPIAGIIGLVGVLKNASNKIAFRILLSTIAVMFGSLMLSHIFNIYS